MVIIMPPLPPKLTYIVGLGGCHGSGGDAPIERKSETDIDHRL